jgi:hypothetical protein
MSRTRSSIELDSLRLEEMRDRFLARIPDFGDFRDRSSTYWQWERKYKDAFARPCRQALGPEVFPEEMTARGAEDIIQLLSQLLTRRHEGMEAPQHLLSWRYFAFLRKLQEEERVRFAEAFRDLLYGEGESPDRVGRFTATMWPIWQRTEGGNPYALSRNFPTLFLMMLSPDTDIAVRTDMFGAASKPLVGDWLLRYAPFSAEHYRDVLAFSSAIRRKLEEWSWRPRDFIDVHSFLWVVTSWDDESGVGSAQASDAVTPQTNPDKSSNDDVEVS